jgi:hypothetical protein
MGLGCTLGLGTALCSVLPGNLSVTQQTHRRTSHTSRVVLFQRLLPLLLFALEKGWHVERVCRVAFFLVEVSGWLVGQMWETRLVKEGYVL